MVGLMIITAAIFYLVMGGIGDYIWTFLGIATAVAILTTPLVFRYSRVIFLYICVKVQRRAFASMRLGFLSYLGMRNERHAPIFRTLVTSAGRGLAQMQSVVLIRRKLLQKRCPLDPFRLEALSRIGRGMLDKRRSIRCTTVSSSSKTSSAR